MDTTIADKLRVAFRKNPESLFTLFTHSGHVLTGRIRALETSITLEADKEIAEVPLDRIEAFSFRVA